MAKQNSAIQNQVNLVGEGTTFEGTLRAESDVRASGRVVGKLEVQGKAIVAETGVVEGEIRATNADVAGRVQGEIHVEERLVLKSTARVDGNIETDRLVVEEGAVFTGECVMGQLPDTGGDGAKDDNSKDSKGKATPSASKTGTSGSSAGSAGKGGSSGGGKTPSSSGTPDSASKGTTKSSAAAKKS